MGVRFQTASATPPGGCYEYAIGDDVVVSKNRFEMLRKVAELRTKHGLPTVGDGMKYLMEYMCPRLPDGFCTKPSAVKSYRVEEVKRDTAGLFTAMLAASDDIERRMEVCVACPSHTTRGFCVDCNGLLEWLYRGFTGRRGRLPADKVLGVCYPDGVMAAAGASVACRPLKAGAEYPSTCWRLSAKDPAIPAVPTVPKEEI